MHSIWEAGTNVSYAVGKTGQWENTVVIPHQCSAGAAVLLPSSGKCVNMLPGLLFCKSIAEVLYAAPCLTMRQLFLLSTGHRLSHSHWPAPNGPLFE